MASVVGRIKTWEELGISDNFIFQKVMSKPRLCKRLIEKILGITVKRITFPETEKDIKIRRDSKSVRLDVYVEDDKGVLYDIEMQTTDSALPSELPKRTRYYQAMMDMDVLNKGEYYSALRKTYIIFICTFDPFDRGLSRYTFHEVCDEAADLQMGDETTKLFLNSKGNHEGLDKDIAAFLDYVDGKAAQGTFTQEIAEETERVKEQKETRVEYMTYTMEMRRQKEEGRKEGRKEGVRLGVVNVAINMLKKNKKLKDIMDATNFSADEIRKIATDNGLAF